MQLEYVPADTYASELSKRSMEKSNNKKMHTLW